MNIDVKLKTKRNLAHLDLGLFPTPLHKLAGISKKMGNKINFYIKRDDMTGIAAGGNKVRKLEYLLADAIEKGYDTIITVGAAQSNHCAITAASANKIGLNTHLILHQKGVCEMKGNQVLYKLMGAQIHWAEGEDMDSSINSKLADVEAELKSQGKKPYIIPAGASVPLGALGYVDCTEEIALQCREQGIELDRIVVTSGSGGTYTGVLLGAKLYLPNCKVTGIDISGYGPYIENTHKLIKECAEMLNITEDLSSSIDIQQYCGEGYAIPSEIGNGAIDTMAKCEGIILDPVYTGKTFGGLLDLCKKGHFKDDENVLFIHTGGTASLFAFY